MNTRSLLSMLLFLALAAGAASPRDEAAPRLDARGFADPRGGRGGVVIRVTTLAADGPGSLREALAARGPRIVVFEVGGVIDLARQELIVEEPFLTVAGQTAPSPGITLVRGTLSIRTHDVVIRHLRVRPGDAGMPPGSGWEPDGINTIGGDAYNVTVDHCSISWAVDENLSASGPRLEGPGATSRRVTFSHCIIAEGLSHSSHTRPEHSKGSLIHDFCREIAIIGNLYAHNMERNPYFKAHTTGVVVNNLIYNPGKKAIQLDYALREWRDSPLSPENSRVSVVGNVLWYGPDTVEGLPLITRRGDAYLEDNLAFDREGAPAPRMEGEIRLLAEKPVWPEGLVPLSATQVPDHIAAHAGARPRDRDETDKRIVRSVLERTGRILDSQEEVGGYPDPPATFRKLDVPETDVEGWLDRMARELEE